MKHNISTDDESELMVFGDVAPILLDLCIKEDPGPAACNVFAALWATLRILDTQARTEFIDVKMDFRDAEARIVGKADLEGDRPVYFMNEDAIVMAWDIDGQGRKIQETEETSSLLRKFYGCPDVSEAVRDAVKAGSTALRKTLDA